MSRPASLVSAIYAPRHYPGQPFPAVAIPWIGARLTWEVVPLYSGPHGPPIDGYKLHIGSDGAGLMGGRPPGLPVVVAGARGLRDVRPVGGATP